MEFDQAVAELDTLVQTLEREGDERALLLLQLMDAVHRPALERIVAGDLEHPLAFALMAMYDLVPLEERVQVEEALDEVRPYIESHGGGLELLDVQDGVVHVRMHGSCHGCAASAVTLRRGVEEKLRERFEGFKEVVSHPPEGEEDNGEPPASGIEARLLQIEHFNGALRAEPSTPAPNGAGAPAPDGAGAPAPGGAGGGDLLQIESLKRPVFVDVGRIEELEPGAIKAVDVDGNSILLVNIGGEPYAFRNVCAVEGRLPLDGGRLTGSVLVCPWHNCAYDARSGKRADDEPGQPSLAVVPIALADGVLKVAANVA
ncbi:MAG: NifU family protein [Solirubrobacterales bacterium]|nr:NifU family protein [Solirubrobacterales bacterium]